jgi:hypothetical protein
VLFTDLVGSTELMSRLGEPAYDRLRGGPHGLLDQARTTAEELGLGGLERHIAELVRAP